MATFAAALEQPGGAVLAFEDGAPGAWRVEAIVPNCPDRAAIEVRLALAAASAGLAQPSFAVEPVEAKDWLALNLASFRPLGIGRFVVHASHHRPPRHRWGLRIDAATAFGTGEHPTTRTCLEALDRLAKQRRLGRVLDLGTGSGLLAIAASRLGAKRVLALDIDTESVAVAKRYARLNHAAVWVARADGYRGPAGRHAPYDLVLANILAGPLARMAPGLARVLAPGGRAIVSGLLTHQERSVLAAHRRVGLRLLGRRSRDGWTTLVLGRPYRTQITSVSIRPSGWSESRR